MIHFAATVLGRPLDPWQQWLVIHLGELLENGRPRFRRVLVIVARQNGKTHLCTVLALFWIFVEKWPLIFGTSNKIEYAVDAWSDAINMVTGGDGGAGVPVLAAQMLKPRMTNGQNDLRTRHGSHYRIGAANADGGRSKRINRAIGDELRRQTDWSAYAAIVPAMNARPDAQIIWITNMGDASSVVLNELRAEGLAAIREGSAHGVGLFEWSAPEDAHPTDVHALAAANPQAGRRNDWEPLLDEARAVSRPGADAQKLATFRTEIMCQTVDSMEPAISPAAWSAAARPAPMPDGRLTACVDVSLDGQHATLAVCGLDDGVYRLELAAAWDGPDALQRLQRDLPGWAATIKPDVLGWFPNSPSAAIDAALRDRSKTGRRAWPPRGVQVAEIRSEVAAVCMGFVQQVDAGGLVHPDDPLLNAHAAAGEKLWMQDKWVFTRKSSGGHVDALYAAAGALHLARTAPVRRRGTGFVTTG